MSTCASAVGVIDNATAIAAAFDLSGFPSASKISASDMPGISLY